MTIQIEQIILHSLAQTVEGSHRAAVCPNLLTVTPEVTSLVGDLHRIYNSKGGKGFGHFDPETTSAFKPLFCDWFENSLEFQPFSNAVTEQFAAALDRNNLSDVGVLLVSHYQALGAEYLLLALLESKESVSVSEALEINRINHLDLGQLQLLARIDLTEWRTQPDSNRYLSFSKGRVGRKLAPFFLDFFGAVEGLDPKAQNRALVEAVDAWCQHRGMEPEAERLCKEQLFGYCNEQASSGGEIALKEVATQLSDESGDFYSFIEESYPLEEQFPADKSALRKLTKFVGSGGGLNISFEQSLFGERISYDAATDTLTIHGTPPNLREQLKRF